MKLMFDSSVNKATGTSTTTLNFMILNGSGQQIVIARREVECQQDFIVSSDLGLMNEATITRGLTAELATVKIMSLGKLWETLFSFKHTLKDNVTELNNVIIGETVKVLIDYGTDLPASMKMTIKSCTIGGTGSNSIEFISDGTVFPLLAHMIRLLEWPSGRV